MVSTECQLKGPDVWNPSIMYNTDVGPIANHPRNIIQNGTSMFKELFPKGGVSMFGPNNMNGGGGQVLLGQDFDP